LQLKLLRQLANSKSSSDFQGTASEDEVTSSLQKSLLMMSNLLTLLQQVNGLRYRFHSCWECLVCDLLRYCSIEGTSDGNFGLNQLSSISRCLLNLKLRSIFHCYFLIYISPLFAFQYVVECFEIFNFNTLQYLKNSVRLALTLVSWEQIPLELDCSNNHLIFVHFEKEGFTQ
jgi:hypothetical protein